MISPPSTSALTKMPSVVPQSNSLMMTSCAISTKRRVRYPEFAVFGAVSAKPLRAPCVEMKYCSTVRPSRKLAVIGVSMISPDGFAISPRIPPHSLPLRAARAWAPQESPHPAALPDLLRASPRSRVRHHEDRIEGFVLARIAPGTQLFHHLACDLFSHMGPDIDDLVVALTVGDQPFGILPLNLVDLALCLAEQFFLLAGNMHVVDAD